MIDEKLDTIQKDLTEMKNWMNTHTTEHKLIDAKLTRHDVIVGALIFVSGLFAAGLVKIIFFGG